MKKRTRYTVCLFSAFFVLWPALSQAGFYISPRAGAAIPVRGGDPAYTVGVTAGYQWFSLLATQATYARMIGTGNAADGDILKAEGVVSLPSPGVTPYASAGVGTVHTSAARYSSWDAMFLFGAGISVTALPVVTLGVGVSYALVRGRPDFIEPVLSIGLSF